MCLLGSLAATVEARGEEGEVTLAFDLQPARASMRRSMRWAPCRCRLTSPRAAPPTRGTASDYQTMFAREEGAVAAPTAGLHFTQRLMQALASGGVSVHFVTLHVGPGTFLPVGAPTPQGHIMHAETGSASAPRPPRR